MDITTSFLYICVFIISVDSPFTPPDSSSTEDKTIMASVGDTATLPCTLSELPKQTQYGIKWHVQMNTVIEASVEKAFPGKGYEDRAVVLLDNLGKGDCSLVLKNVQLSDADVYICYLVISGDSELKPISTVNFSVEGPRMRWEGDRPVGRIASNEWGLIHEGNVQTSTQHRELTK